MPTIRDVAKLAAVSVSTVSLAINSPHRVKAKTLQRVQDAVRELGYSPDPLAHGLAVGRSKFIGLVTANISNDFFSDIRRQIQTVAATHGYFVLVVDSGGDPERERDLLGYLAGLKIAGLAIAPNGRDSAYVDYLHRLAIPIVAFDQKVPGLNCDFIGTDNRLASAMLTEHLLRLGHRRIALIGGPAGLHTADERRAGFHHAIENSGFPDAVGLFINGAYRKSEAYAQSMRLLTGSDRPSAVIGANNTMALSALQAMQELGFGCPQDVSLAMIDEIEWGNVMTPQITMAVQDTQEIGRLVATRLLHRILSPEGAAEPPQDRIIPPSFVPGTSTIRYSGR